MLKNTNIFRKFLYSYICVLALPAIMCLLLFGIIFAALNMQSERTYLNEAERAVSAVSAELNSIDAFSSQIINGGALTAYIRDKSAKNIKELENQLILYTNADGRIENVAFYTLDDDYVITGMTRFELKNIYGRSVCVNDMSYEEFKNNYLSERVYRKLFNVDNFTFFDREGEKLVYVTSYPFENRGYVTGQLAIIVDEEEILGIIREKTELPIELVMKNKRDGRQMLRLSDGYKSGKLLYSTDINGFTYEIRLDRTNLKSQTTVLVWIIFAVILVLLLISAVIAYIMTDKNISPVDKLLKNVNKKTGRDISLENLDELFDEIMEKEISMTNEISANREIVKNNLLKQLYSGEYENEDAFRDELKQLKIDFDGAEYAAIAVEICCDQNKTYGQINSIRIILNHMINEEFTALGAEIDKNTEAYVFAFENSNLDEDLLKIENFFIGTAAMFRSESDIKFKISVSGFSKRILDAADAIEKTVNNLSSGIPTYMDGIMWYSSAGNVEREPCWFPSKLKQKIKSCFLNREYDKAYEIIDEVFEENQRNFVVYRDEIEILIFEFKILIRSLMSELRFDGDCCLKINSMLAVVRNDSILKDNYQKLTDVFHAMEKMRDDTGETDDSVEVRMIEYINKNFRDSNLCRQMLAEHFGITPQYASKCFKDKVGENFLDYLERIRVEEACRLLARGESVENAAREVGYQSSVSFRRVFKKRMGQTPTQYVSGD